MANKEPICKFKAGQISAAIWENDVPMNGKTVSMMKVSVQRRYKDKDGKWQSSTSFGRNEIPLAIYCLEKAFQTMIEEQNGSNAEASA